jgi:hypothetical protein
VKSPKPLDVVWCNFPLREALDSPGPKARPVLVLNILPDGTIIAAAYGTSQAHAAPRDWELRHEAQRGTLTTFDLSRVLQLPATREYFPLGLPALRTFPAARFAEIVAADAAARAELAARRRKAKK